MIEATIKVLEQQKEGVEDSNEQLGIILATAAAVSNQLVKTDEDRKALVSIFEQMLNGKGQE